MADMIRRLQSAMLIICLTIKNWLHCLLWFMHGQLHHLFIYRFARLILVFNKREATTANILASTAIYAQYVHTSLV
ncbi:hypothetical protein DL89DRAFT_112698 [Linderina pennispora]|uniref:Uncharacterized protein n=1 Tax=Linderina pennispora TaxID=61395 RepID=A0A1Y1WGN7_9FUNG|nr:uncharacterized protein DL89DRAFT_112698 [Linderina pennispora]ORX72396.1 hypothetical protein DL89DRAFT_112698 [Linderina pennispora]